MQPGKKGRKRRATFAKKNFTVPANGNAKVKFKLSRRNRLILKRYKKLRIGVTVRLRNSANLTSTSQDEDHAEGTEVPALTTAAELTGVGVTPRFLPQLSPAPALPAGLRALSQM